jgi:serine/threonine-protein kinase
MKNPKKLGRYKIISELGHGEMGTVYKAYDSNLERTVALKTIKLDLTKAERNDFEARFYREAKAAARLTHPNIVIVYDAGEIDDVAYIAMEYLEGQTLRAIIDSNQLTVEHAISYAIQIAEGLSYAHNNQIVHRDIKPANVMRLANGILKITDFGIAQLPTGSLTHTGMVLGSPKYMSPEQVEGKRVDGRSDIFSLGTVVYEMLTTEVPFTGDNVTTMMYKILYVAPEDPRILNKKVPDAINLILAKCLAKDPAERYQTAAELVADLKNSQTAAVTNESASEAFNTHNPVGAKLEKAPQQSDIFIRNRDALEVENKTREIPATSPRSGGLWRRLGIILGGFGLIGGAGYFAVDHWMSLSNTPEIIQPSVPAQSQASQAIPVAPANNNLMSNQNAQTPPKKDEPATPVKKKTKPKHTEKQPKKTTHKPKPTKKTKENGNEKKSLFEQIRDCYKIKDPKCPPQKNEPVSGTN